jgi:hypothetical protein
MKDRPSAAFYYFDAVDHGEAGFVFLFKSSRREPVMYADVDEAKRLLRELQEAIEALEKRDA